MIVLMVLFSNGHPSVVVMSVILQSYLAPAIVISQFWITSALILVTALLEEFATVMLIGISSP